MNNYEIDQRAQHILSLLVSEYIAGGQPVASKALAAHNLGLSPASIRAIMAELEQAGFLQSPHTSAGRIPTLKGYRFFVDSLLCAQSLQENSLQDWDLKFTAANPTSLIAQASDAIARLTQLVGIVSLPRKTQTILRHIEFLPLTEKRILVILVLNDHDVQNRIIETTQIYSASELEQAGNYLTSHFAGKNLATIRELLLASMRDHQSESQHIMQSMIAVADQALQMGAPADDYVLSGQTHLFTLAQEQGVERLRELFDAFNQKRDLLQLLDRCVQAQGVQIFIGEESGYQALDSCSIITAPYGTPETVLGVLGVIGPTRLPYAKMIKTVDITAKLLTAALSRQ